MQRSYDADGLLGLIPVADCSNLMLQLNDAQYLILTSLFGSDVRRSFSPITSSFVGDWGAEDLMKFLAVELPIRYGISVLVIDGAQRNAGSLSSQITSEILKRQGDKEAKVPLADPHWRAHRMGPSQVWYSDGLPHKSRQSVLALLSTYDLFVYFHDLLDTSGLGPDSFGAGLRGARRKWGLVMVNAEASLRFDTQTKAIFQKFVETFLVLGDVGSKEGFALTCRVWIDSPYLT